MVENMHEAIVTHEEFQRVHELLKLGKPRGAAKTIEYPLKGKVHCSECRRAMSRLIGRKGLAYYICCKSDSEPDASCPHGKHFMEADIERVVLHAIQQMLTLYQQKESREAASRFTRTGQITACMKELARLQQLQERHRQEKLRLYEKLYLWRIWQRTLSQKEGGNRPGHSRFGGTGKGDRTDTGWSGKCSLCVRENRWTN